METAGKKANYPVVKAEILESLEWHTRSAERQEASGLQLRMRTGLLVVSVSLP